MKRASDVRVYITGAPLAGSLELARSIGRTSLPPFDPFQPPRLEFTVPYDGSACLTIRLAPRIAAVFDLVTDLRFDDARAFLAHADVAVFVVDSQHARDEANREALHTLERVVAHVGR